jgi:hypothetical protein
VRDTCIAGGKLALLPVAARGRRTRNDITVLCAHADVINDFCFLPFLSSSTLVTASKDDTVCTLLVYGDAVHSFR